MDKNTFVFISVTLYVCLLPLSPLPLVARDKNTSMNSTMRKHLPKGKRVSVHKFVVTTSLKTTSCTKKLLLHQEKQLKFH